MSLPTGFTVRVHDDVETMDQGRLLVGGSPLRAVRLSPRGSSMVDDGELRVLDAAGGLVADRLLEANIALPVLCDDGQARADQLTVVVPVRDRPEQLGRALAGLCGLAVVVVDDASHAPRAVAAVARAHRAEILHLDHNVGPAAARNAGLASVTTPYVAFVDSDVTVTADTLLGLTAHFADPRVALVAPHVRGRPVSANPRWFERYDEAAPALGLGERAGVVRPGAAVAWLPSACLVARTQPLTDEPIVGFDGRLRVGEDVDLVWRLVAAGHRVRYDPAFEAHHDARPTLRAWMSRKFVYGTGGAELAERHPDNVVTAVLSPAMGLTALALLARRPWSAPLALVGLARSTQVLHRSLPDIPGRGGLAARLSLRGLGWSLRQESALILRHWWPLALAASLTSRRARRILGSALVVDLVAAQVENPELDTALGFAGRRLDDLAYGAGLWCGALRQVSLRCLAIRVVTRSRTKMESTDGADVANARKARSDRLIGSGRLRRIRGAVVRPMTSRSTLSGSGPQAGRS